MGKFQKILLLEIRYNLYFADKSVKLLAFLVIRCVWCLFFINLVCSIFTVLHSNTWKNQHFNNWQLPQGPSACHLCLLKKLSTFLWHPEHRGSSQKLMPHHTSSHQVKEAPLLLWKSVHFWTRLSESGPDVWDSRGARWDNAWHLGT